LLHDELHAGGHQGKLAGKPSKTSNHIIGVLVLLLDRWSTMSLACINTAQQLKHARISSGPNI
jgi:hypothetical protein